MHHRNYTRSSNVEALSIYHQQKREKRGQKADQKHILGLLSSFTRQDAEVRCEQAQQLCCYDRMRKLIAKRQTPDEAAEKDQISSIVIEQKINKMQNLLKKSMNQKPQKVKLHQRTASLNNFNKKTIAIEELKKGCLNKYVSHQVGKRQKDLDDAKKIVNRQVNCQIDSLIEDKGLQLTKIKQENEKLKKEILELNLQIQGFRSKSNQMQDYIEQLQEKNLRRQTKKFISKCYDQDFEEQFREIFGECTLEELKFKMDVGISKCLAGFEKAENRNQQKLHQQKLFFDNQQERMKKTINKLQKSENDLLGNLKTLKLNQQLSQIQLDELTKAKSDLESLQKLILSQYTQWYEKRSQNEKNVLKLVGGLSQNYSYQQMVKYIINFNKTYSSNQKLNDYLFKILRGIQKLRRTIYPQQCNQKLDPLIAIEQLQKWIKRRNKVSISKKTTLVQSNYIYEE